MLGIRPIPRRDARPRMIAPDPLRRPPMDEGTDLEVAAVALEARFAERGRVLIDPA